MAQETVTDVYVDFPKLLFQLPNGIVKVQRLPNTWLPKSAFGKNQQLAPLASENSNNEEDKENNSKMYNHQDKNNDGVTVKCLDKYRIIRREDGGATKHLMSAYCKHCDKEVVNIDETDAICNTCNNNYSIYTCGKCNGNYTNFNSLKTHMYKICNPLIEYVCCYCAYKCSRASEIQIHVRKHQSPTSLKIEESDAQIQCDLCPFKTSFKSGLLIHLKAKHSEAAAESRKETASKEIQCLNCRKVFVNNNGLREHELYCQKSPTIQCRFCTFKTYRPWMLKLHLKRKHGKIQFRNNPTNYFKNLKKNEADEEEGTFQEELPYIIKRLQIDSQIMMKRFCKDCKKPHNKRRGSCLWCNGDIQYACLKCKRIFPNYDKIKNHVRHTCYGKTLYVCKKCKTSRTTKDFILNHIIKAHNDG